MKKNIPRLSLRLRATGPLSDIPHTTPSFPLPNALLSALGYQFRNPSFLQEALTHASTTLPKHNERLEFLGDALLGLVMAQTLFDRYPTAKEGELTRLRASLINRQTLAALARQLHLDQYLHLGQGAVKTHEAQRDSTLSCALEAVLGAIYLDGGLSAAQSVILCLYQGLLSDLPSSEALKDPKSRLQEYLQACQKRLPVYQVVHTSGTAHQPCFSVQCIAGETNAIATGHSRRAAEQEAARLVLLQLQGDPHDEQ